MYYIEREKHRNILSFVEEFVCLNEICLGGSYLKSYDDGVSSFPHLV